MTKKIVSFGDSFVYGSELQNNNDGSKSWIGQAAQRLAVDYETRSIPGCGNEAIARQIYSYFSNNPSQDVLAVINWTWGARWDFYVTGHEQWTTLGLTCVPSKLKPLVGQEEAEKILEFYKNYPGNSTLWDKWRTLQAIYGAQQYLNGLDVVSVQTFMDYEMWDDTWHAPDYIRNLQSMTRGVLENFQGRNFLDWSWDRGYKVTDPGWHPLEQAHENACELWIDRYRTLLKI